MGAPLVPETVTVTESDCAVVMPDEVGLTATVGVTGETALTVRVTLPVAEL